MGDLQNLLNIILMKQKVVINKDMYTSNVFKTYFIYILFNALRKFYFYLILFNFDIK